MDFLVISELFIEDKIFGFLSNGFFVDFKRQFIYLKFWVTLDHFEAILGLVTHDLKIISNKEVLRHFRIFQSLSILIHCLFKIWISVSNGSEPVEGICQSKYHHGVARQNSQAKKNYALFESLPFSISFSTTYHANKQRNIKQHPFFPFLHSYIYDNFRLWG